MKLIGEGLENKMINSKRYLLKYNKIYCIFKRKFIFLYLNLNYSFKRIYFNRYYKKFVESKII